MFNRVAAIYDIHGNATALQAVLKEIQNCTVDEIVVGGDLVWGPQPALVMEQLLSLSGNVYVIRGNTDRYVAGRYGIEQGLDDWSAKLCQWCVDQLTEQQIDFLQNLQENVTISIAGLGEVLFVHGSPRSDVEGILEDTPEFEIAQMMSAVSQDIVVCGHTHTQFERNVMGKRIINPGSVGLQRRARGACWALIGPTVDLRETEYDYQYAADQFLRSNAPLANEFAEHVLNPPTDERN